MFYYFMRLFESLFEVFFSFGLNIILFGLNVVFFGIVFEFNLFICFFWKVFGVFLYFVLGFLGRFMGIMIVALN